MSTEEWAIVCFNGDECLILNCSDGFYGPEKESFGPWLSDHGSEWLPADKTRGKIYKLNTRNKMIETGHIKVIVTAWVPMVLSSIAEQAERIKDLEEALEDLKASNLGCSDFIVLQRLMETAIKMYEVKS